MSHGSVATRWNLDLLDDQYQRWCKDPSSVDESWRIFFEGFELGNSQQPAPVADERLQAAVFRLIYGYRDIGHFLARLDPLSEARTNHPLLDLSYFGFTDADLDRSFDATGFRGLTRVPLRQLLTALRETYSRTIGVEYMHIQDT